MDSRAETDLSFGFYLSNARTERGRGRGQVAQGPEPRAVGPHDERVARSSQTRQSRSPLSARQTAPEWVQEARALSGRELTARATRDGARRSKEAPSSRGTGGGGCLGARAVPPWAGEGAPRVVPPAGGGAAQRLAASGRRKPRPAGGGPAPRPTCGKERAGLAREGPLGGGRGVPSPARVHWLRPGRAGPAQPTIGRETWAFAYGPGAGFRAGGGARGPLPLPPPKLGREPATAPRRVAGDARGVLGSRAGTWAGQGRRARTAKLDGR
ncbi:skin secretory protein xP2 [Bos taurus]|uniref:skin secretory protein xP2 n=1 Tax=Bos taurus TaxID=9913 RepID=UPI0028CBB42E|nr:skin secretory protein xP2-like [Bos taurus]